MKSICAVLAILSTMIITAADAQSVTMKITNPPASGTVIPADIYGQFAEHLGRSIYDGFYRNGTIRMDVVNALKAIHIPNLRWPGGCFADQYHWRDGIGDKSKRPKTVNTTWGMVTEDNSFGTDEFMEMCRLIGCEPYIAGNVGTGTPQEMKDWIEYLNFKGNSTMADMRKANGHEQPMRVSLWGVGNESWGCGGNMTPEHYADLYRHFATFCPDYPGAPLKKVASGANGDDYAWMDTLMRKIPANEMYGVSMHYYTFPTGKWNPRGSATHFPETEYFSTLKQALHIEEVIEKHEAIMDKYDPAKKVALMVDEWGVWTDVEPGTNPSFMYQQNSLRDALMAASTLNIFNNHADRVRGANLAQTVNVIHSLILTKEDQMLKTPTYYVFDLFQAHQNSRLLKIDFKSPQYQTAAGAVPAINASASIDSTSTMHVTIVNLDPVNAIAVSASLAGLEPKKASGRILTSTNVSDINDFGKEQVNIKPFDKARLSGDQLSVTLPPKSVVRIDVSCGKTN